MGKSQRPGIESFISILTISCWDYARCLSKDKLFLKLCIHLSIILLTDVPNMGSLYHSRKRRKKQYYLVSNFHKVCVRIYDGCTYNFLTSIPIKNCDKIDFCIPLQPYSDKVNPGVNLVDPPKLLYSVTEPEVESLFESPFSGNSTAESLMKEQPQEHNAERLAVEEPSATRRVHTRNSAVDTTWSHSDKLYKFSGYSSDSDTSYVRDFGVNRSSAVDSGNFSTEYPRAQSEATNILERDFGNTCLKERDSVPQMPVVEAN